MNLNKKLFLILFFIFFTTYTFTSDAHRSQPDENYTQLQAERIVLQEPDPKFVLGESTNQFTHPQFVFPHGLGPKCAIGILCYPVGIVYSATEVPFIFLNHHLNFITTETVTYTVNDFPDAHYVFWRNSLNPDHTFMELFYGPFFSSLAVATFFLISRSFNYKVSTSLVLAFLLGLTTIFFSYSQTSFNHAPSALFILLGFLFFKKFMDNQKIFYSIISAILLIFAFMIRNDTVYFLIPLFFFFIASVVFHKTWTLSGILQKLKKISSFTIPLILGYQFNKTIESMRLLVEAGPISSISNIATDSAGVANTFLALSTIPRPLYESYFGMLLSPGAGLFVYVPILLLVFLSFPDFFRKNKAFSLVILVITTLFVVDFGSMNHWQGFTAWSPKYLFIIIPFLLLPLGATIEKRGKRILPIIFTLGAIGFFFNFVNVIQDVTWFVWGNVSASPTGLMSLAVDPEIYRQCALYICPEVVWTFQFSPLINSINSAVNNLHPDLFLLKLFGGQYYFLTLVSILSIGFYLLYRTLKSEIKPTNNLNQIN